MKYIGSGLWAVSAAILSAAHGGGVDTAAFLAIALGILIFGKDKNLVTINNNFNQDGD